MTDWFPLSERPVTSYTRQTKKKQMFERNNARVAVGRYSYSGITVYVSLQVGSGSTGIPHSVAVLECNASTLHKLFAVNA